MSQNAKSSLPVMVATAAVTLAVGVTVATLGGYVTPKAPPAPATSEPAPEVVAPAAPDPEPEPTFASFRSHEKREHHEHHEHHDEDER